MRAIAMVAVACFGLPVSGPAAPRDNAVLYFFFSPQMTDAPAAAKRAVQFMKKHRGQVTLRPVLLTRDFSRLGNVDGSSPIVSTIKELRNLGTLDIPLFDREGLGLAEHWKVDRGPAFVLVYGKRAHKAYGSRADLESLRRCKR